VATGPGDQMAAAPDDHGRMRASRADREQVIDTLKAAFVQGRLSHDELGERVARALVPLTYAELATLTDDLPAGLTPVAPPRQGSLAGAGAYVTIVAGPVPGRRGRQRQREPSHAAGQRVVPQPDLAGGAGWPAGAARSAGPAGRRAAPAGSGAGIARPGLSGPCRRYTLKRNV
jgi:Domain of unknown function (DUF1707)